jgi:heme-degrading monooxygenase HmoA
MLVLLTMQVGPVDWEKFRSALDWASGQNMPGLLSSKTYRAEDDPSTVIMIQEWESHEAFHKVGDEVGPEFVSRAGMEGAEWIDRTWTLAHEG